MPVYFADLSLKDERTRRRLARLLDGVDDATREFAYAEVLDLAGRSERLGPILRRLFLELPYFPSRKIGEVKMFRVRMDALKELTERLAEALGSR